MLRTIRVSTEDGQNTVIQYDTEATDNASLQAEVLSKLDTSAIFILTTDAIGSTATFYAPVNAVAFMT